MTDEDRRACLDEDHEQYAGEAVEVNFETGEVTVLPATAPHEAAARLLRAVEDGPGVG